MVNPSFFCVVSETIFLSGKIFRIRYTPIVIYFYGKHCVCRNCAGAKRTTKASTHHFDIAYVGGLTFQYITVRYCCQV